MAQSPDVCAIELAKLLDQQTAICRDILALSQKQQALVEEHKEDDLLRLLNEKQILLNRHKGLMAKTNPFREEWETSARDLAGPQAHQKVEAAWNALTAVLDDIIRLEDASREVLQDQHGKVTQEINKLQRGKAMNKAYGGSYKVPPAARYSDKKG